MPSEQVKINFDLDQLRGQQLADALQSTVVLEQAARAKGRDALAGYWFSAIEVLLAVALREQAEDGSSLALTRFHNSLPAAS